MDMPTADIKLVGEGTDVDGWERREWAVTLHHEGRSMNTRYYTGMALGEPDAEDVLYSLFQDAAGIEFVDVDGWVEEYGFPIESMADARKYERQYAEIERQSKELRLLLGDDYQPIQDAIGGR